MSSARLGAFHSSYISFSRSLTRVMAAQQWRITCHEWTMDGDGIGRAIYHVRAPRGVYSLLFLTHSLDAAQRCDRVIARAWDVTFCLFRGEMNEDDAARLARNLPQQERGRYCAKTLCVSRANKSARNFDYVVECLAAGEQPDAARIAQTGYLVRTTAVYGNGKFGMADYAQLQDTDFAEQYRAQMFCVYMARLFTLEWAEFIARRRAPADAARLAARARRFMGVGNSTGLGMMPFLIKHPDIVNAWARQREMALREIFSVGEVSDAARHEFGKYWRRAADFFAGFCAPDNQQRQKNELLAREIATVDVDDAALARGGWTPVWRGLAARSPDLQELFLNVLLEIYPRISTKYDRFGLLSAAEPALSLDWTVAALARAIRRRYGWALRCDFSRDASRKFFWYRSEDKEEPRLGCRQTEAGAEREMKIGVAEDVRRLYDALAAEEDGARLAVDFLLAQPQFAGEVLRVWRAARGDAPYGEIRANILDAGFYPIDLLRFKLSFFGAVKFDPKSERWLRITLFQGAPLPDARGVLRGEDDDWFLAVYDS